ncbi:MAG: DUF4082 domain-containing protein, partial [Microlunatus sp.]|nr:DUF4082 domain-containing protein [Microlunatus sp.]
TTGVAYTASYHAPVGRYAGDVGTLSAEQPKRTRALTATQGVYTYKSGMPKSVWRDSNYYVDVVFTTVPPDSISGATGTTAPKPSTTTALPRPTTTAPRPTTIASPTQAAPSVKGWPDASTTGVAQCPALEKVRTGGQVMLTSDGQTYENKEFLEPTVINVRAQNVTIRCVKFNGTGWYGIDNTDRPSSVTVDRVEINCQDKGQVVGMLLRDATVSRANVHNCDHMINAGGDNLTIRDSYCHALTDKPVVHADCIQSMGGNTNLRIEHNSLWSRDTSDILLGDEYGLAKNVVIHDNRLMSEGDPPPAYLLYLGGTNTVVTDNRFTRRYTYGHCTDIAKPGAQTVWSGNVWDDDGSPVRSC